MFTVRKGAWPYLLALAVLATAGGSEAATFRVEMHQSGKDFFFVPTNIIIHLGDKVTWTNTEVNAHDSTHRPDSGSALWASPLISSLTPNDSFSYTFTKPGLYRYICRTHYYRGHPEEHGLVVVTNLPPSVVITSPTNGAFFFAPADLTIAATASDADGRVVAVELFLNAVSLGIVTNSPSTNQVLGLGGGDYGLWAVATDNLGARATSGVVNLRVSADQPIFPLDATTAGGGMVVPTPFFERYPSNGIVRVTATPAFGWTFLGWTGDVDGTNPIVTLTMDRRRCVQATFGTAARTSVTGSGSISIIPASALYPYGTALRAVAEPEPGNYFVRWTNAVGSSVNPQTFVVNAATPTFSAQFAPLIAGQFALTVAAEGAGRVELAPNSNVYVASQTVALTAFPNAGEVFTGWSGEVNGIQNPIQLVMDTSKTIRARFSTRPRLVVNHCPGWMPGDALRLILMSELGQACRIESSADLVTWTTLLQVTNGYGTTQLKDSDSANSARFYRALGSN